MKPWVLLLGCLLAAASLAQTTTTRREVWEWRDANGVMHYSDAPAPGARKIVIVGSTTSAAPPNVAPRTASTGGGGCGTTGAGAVHAPRDLAAGERCLVLRAGFGRQRAHPLGAGAAAGRPAADLPGRQARERPEPDRARADGCRARCALGDERDPRRQGQREDPQPAGRVPHQAGSHRTTRRTGDRRSGRHLRPRRGRERPDPARSHAPSPGRA